MGLRRHCGILDAEAVRGPPLCHQAGQRDGTITGPSGVAFVVRSLLLFSLELIPAISGDVSVILPTAHTVGGAFCVPPIERAEYARRTILHLPPGLGSEVHYCGESDMILAKERGKSNAN